MKEPEPALQPDSVAEPASEPATVRKEATVQPHRPTVQRLAVKTNLLYDAILMPSLEVEYRIADRWTVNLEGDMAWWNNDGKHKCYQVATISPEGRWWFGQKQGSPWHATTSACSAASWYDLENGKEGYQGEAEMVGVSYGYMFPIGRRLSLEAGIGLGYMHSKYEEYLPIDGHYVYQQTNRMNYFGPLKLKFALVWRLWDTDKRKEAHDESNATIYPHGAYVCRIDIPFHELPERPVLRPRRAWSFREGESLPTGNRNGNVLTPMTGKNCGKRTGSTTMKICVLLRPTEYVSKSIPATDSV